MHLMDYKNQLAMLVQDKIYFQGDLLDIDTNACDIIYKIVLHKEFYMKREELAGKL
jgi:hypothetical protein